MSAMASQNTGSPLFTQPFVQARIKENVKAPRHWPLWGKPVNTPQKGPVTRKIFLFHDVMIILHDERPTIHHVWLPGYLITASLKCVNMNIFYTKYFALSCCIDVVSTLSADAETHFLHLLQRKLFLLATSGADRTRRCQNDKICVSMHIWRSYCISGDHSGHGLSLCETTLRVIPHWLSPYHCVFL